MGCGYGSMRYGVWVWEYEVWGVGMGCGYGSMRYGWGLGIKYKVGGMGV